MLNKEYWYLGHNNLKLILEQDRKHWSLKINKKQTQTVASVGSRYIGKINNDGSVITIESEKTNEDLSYLKTIKFTDDTFNNILNVDESSFPYCPEMNGLLCEKIVSTNASVSYRIKFTNCTIVTRVLGASVNSNDVVATQWLRTTSKPIISVMSAGGSTTSTELSFTSTSVTNPVYYFPLATELQTIPVTLSGSDYVTPYITFDEFIGKPLFWFTCDQTNLGPSISFTETTSTNQNPFHLGKNGLNDKYHQNVYVNVYGDTTFGTDAIDNSTLFITVDGANNTTHDFELDLFNTTNTIYFSKTDGSSEQHHTYTVTRTNATSIKMNVNAGWEYVTGTTYKLDMAKISKNKNAHTNSQAIFDVVLSTSISFYTSTTNYGYAGIQMVSDNNSGQTDRYTHELNQWDGLPTWMSSLTTTEVTQHLALYAIHNTANSTSSPTTKQTAALLLDPGKINTTSNTLANDERGRVYVLSNDSTTYENNSTATNKKPDRTVARICDIPTSISQLIDVTNLATQSVIDPDYIRTEASYNTTDKDRLYNTLGNRWVKPSDKTGTGISVMDTYTDIETNKFVFRTLEGLNSVDLVNHNSYRKTVHLNEKVLATDVSINSITNAGSGYAVNDVLSLVVGGYGFQLIVSSVDTTGGVTRLTLTTTDTPSINVNNFNTSSGITSEYGTTNLSTSAGSGCKLKLQIANYNENYAPTQGDIFSDLFALLTESDGVYIYSYELSSTTSTEGYKLTGTWTQQGKISENDSSTSEYLSTKDSYMTTLVPRVMDLPIYTSSDDSSETSIRVYKTANYVNVCDTSKLPIGNVSGSNTNVVDMCKFVASKIVNGVSFGEEEHTLTGVINVLKGLNKLRYMSYLLWKINEADSSKFDYFFIYNSFNNLITTDTVSLIPNSDLNCKNYVNTNISTTVTWNINTNTISNMVWVYNPKYSMYEEYKFDDDTNDLRVYRGSFTWNDVTNTFDNGIINNNTTKICYNDSGVAKLAWNVASNIPYTQPDYETGDDVVYQIPEFAQVIDKDTVVDTLEDYQLPAGTWQLIFPRINQYTFTSTATTGMTFNPTKMELIKMQTDVISGNVIDEYGKNVNERCIILGNSSSESAMYIYNTYSNNWEQI